MANTRQAKKRIRQAEKHRAHNVSQRSEMRTHLKRVKKAIEAGDLSLAKQEYQLTVSTLDAYAHKGIIHQNKANRHKSRLSAQIKLLEGKAAA